MLDANNRIITNTTNFVQRGATMEYQIPSSSNTAIVNKPDTCAAVYEARDASGGQRTAGCPNGLTVTGGQSSCCQACNSDNDCTFWVYALPTQPDPSGKNCWLMMNVGGTYRNQGRTSGGATLPGNPSVQITLGRDTKELYYGAGGEAGSDMVQTQSTPFVDNTLFWTPHYWSTGGYAAFGVSPLLADPAKITHYPADWSQFTSTNPGTQWAIAGDRVDLYLMPAPTAYDGLRTYYDIIGYPRVSPRYAHGYIACRWGWTDPNYISSILTQFRSGAFPIDAFVTDFEWYTTTPDYELPVTGSPSFVDFKYNSVLFPSPVSQLNDYHNNFKVRFGGIRKPRLGNSDLLATVKNKGWLLPNARDLNYSKPEVRSWYADNTMQFLKDGVDFYWNDEGETQYFTFFYWNQAQVDGLTSFAPNKRFFTINRNYAPGLSRLGGTLWTGDVFVSWEALKDTPGYLLNWALAGVGYTTVDIGGFRGGDTPTDLLIRWYQVGVFMSLMRVHSSLENKAHFPFLYGKHLYAIFSR
jgi:alpha-glucosidase